MNQKTTPLLVMAAVLASSTAYAADVIMPAPVMDAAPAFEAPETDPWAGTRWMFRARLLGVLPDLGDKTVNNAPADLSVGDSVVPELDITYFFNDNFAAELILGVTPHKAKVGDTEVTDLLLLPPTLTFQYHHAFGAFKPYVGAGINYTNVIDSDPTADFDSVDSWDDSFGPALQVGFDYAINERWSVNLDVKKVWMQLDGTVGNAKTPVSVEVDPWIIGTGIGLRF